MNLVLGQFWVLAKTPILGSGLGLWKPLCLQSYVNPIIEFCWKFHVQNMLFWQIYKHFCKGMGFDLPPWGPGANKLYHEAGANRIKLEAVLWGGKQANIILISPGWSLYLEKNTRPLYVRLSIHGPTSSSIIKTTPKLSFGQILLTSFT